MVIPATAIEHWLDARLSSVWRRPGMAQLQMASVAKRTA